VWRDGGREGRATFSRKEGQQQQRLVFATTETAFFIIRWPTRYYRTAPERFRPGERYVLSDYSADETAKTILFNLPVP